MYPTTIHGVNYDRDTAHKKVFHSLIQILQEECHPLVYYRVGEGMLCVNNKVIHEYPIYENPVAKIFSSGTFKIKGTSRSIFRRAVIPVAVEAGLTSLTYIKLNKYYFGKPSKGVDKIRYPDLVKQSNEDFKNMRDIPKQVDNKDYTKSHLVQINNERYFKWAMTYFVMSIKNRIHLKRFADCMSRIDIDNLI